MTVQCTATASVQSFSDHGTFATPNGRENKQCSRNAKVNTLCTQHEQVRLGNLMVAKRRARMAERREAVRQHDGSALVIAEHQKGILQLEGFTVSALNLQTGRFDIYAQPERWEYVSLQQFHSLDEPFQITTPVLTLNAEGAEQLMKEMQEASWVQRALALVGTAAQRGD